MTDFPQLFSVSLLRKSDERQENSIDRQRMMYREYCERYGLLDVGEYCDPGVSASKTRILDRPAVKRLLADAPAARWTIVWCEEISRAGRKGEEVVDLDVRLQASNAVLVGPNDDPRAKLDAHMRKLLLFIHGWKAEGETLQLGRRIRDTKRKLAAEGQYTGGYMPTGLRWDGESKRWVVDEAGAKVVCEVFRLYGETGSCQRVAKNLTDAAIPAPRGGPWYASSVLRLVRNPCYRGRMQMRGVEYPTDLPEVVPTALVARADTLLALCDGRPQRSVGSVTTRALFAGLLRCPECGAWLNSALNAPNGSRGKTYIHYRCPHAYLQPQTCGWRHYIPQMSLEQALLPRLCASLDSYRPEARPQDRAAKRAAAVRDDLQQERERIIALHVRGRIDEAESERLLASVEERLSRLAEAPAEPQTRHLTAQEARSLANKLRRLWPTLTIPQQREFLQMMLESVTPAFGSLPDSAIAWRVLPRDFA